MDSSNIDGFRELSYITILRHINYYRHNPDINLGIDVPRQVLDNFGITLSEHAVMILFKYLVVYEYAKLANRHNYSILIPLLDKQTSEQFQLPCDFEIDNDKFRQIILLHNNAEDENGNIPSDPIPDDMIISTEDLSIDNLNNYITFIYNVNDSEYPLYDILIDLNIQPKITWDNVYLLVGSFDYKFLNKYRLVFDVGYRCIEFVHMNAYPNYVENKFKVLLGETYGDQFNYLFDKVPKTFPHYNPRDDPDDLSK